jgi:hypothetical protein
MKTTMSEALFPATHPLNGDSRYQIITTTESVDSLPVIYLLIDRSVRRAEGVEDLRSI